MSKDNRPFQEMFLNAVHARMAAANEGFHDAYALCKMTHKGTFQAMENEAKEAKAARAAANNAAPSQSSGQANGGEHPFMAKVNDEMQKQSINFQAAWEWCRRAHADLWNDFNNKGASKASQSSR